MHQAHSADSGRHAATPKSRVSKFLAAGVAVAGATAIAATPISPVIDDIKAQAQAQERAVALAAAADPLVLIQRFLAEAQLNSGYLGSNGTNAYAAVASQFLDGDLAEELSNIVSGNLSNPTPLFTRLSQFGDVYGDDLQIAFFGREDDPTTGVDENYDGIFERQQLAFTEFQTLLADLQNYDPAYGEGQFTNAAFELNSFFVFGVLDNLRPLIGGTPTGIVPLFSIPGDFLGGEVAGGFEGALPGFDRLDNLINVLNEQTLVRAATGPFQTSFFRVAQSLDDALAAYEAGDTEDAIKELANIPILATDAFVNGFAPVFSPGGEEWPSLLDPRQQQAGLFKYLAVDLPNQILTALGAPTVTPQLPPAPVAPTPPGTTGSALLASTGPAAGTVDLKITPAPELPAADEEKAGDPAKLVSDTTVVDAPADEADEVIEGTEEDAASTPAKPAKKTYKPGDGLKALKKAGDDFNKGVKDFFTPKKKKDSTKAEPTTTAGDATAGNAGGGTAGGDTGGTTGGDTGDSTGGDNGGGDSDK